MVDVLVLRLDFARHDAVCRTIPGGIHFSNNAACSGSISSLSSLRFINE
jgi:hypothetical protein